MDCKLKLKRYESLYYRDLLRAGRYAGLADAEGFQEICFALEALGMRLLGSKASLGAYRSVLESLSVKSVVLTEISSAWPGHFSRFEPLFNLVKIARNDAMHTGVYARHVTNAAIELCIGLEEALMTDQSCSREYVADFMVKTPVIVEPWQPIAHVRQLMLTHSFSYLPVCLEGWKLISEASMARYMRSGASWKKLLSATVEEAVSEGLELELAKIVTLQDEVRPLLRDLNAHEARLWLVQDDNARLCGVLTPFELI